MRSFASISDVHLRKDKPERESLFLSFMQQQIINKTNEIFLLGDIFDVLVGTGNKKFVENVSIFNIFKEYMSAGGTINFFAGNHDFYLEDFFNYNFNEYFNKTFYYYEKPITKIFSGKKILFAHGDTEEIGNLGYRLFNKLIKNSVTKKIANFKTAEYYIQELGRRMSDDSRLRNEFSDYKKSIIEFNFLKLAELLATKEGADAVILGHSHMRSDISIGGKIQYLNNGYCPETHEFVSFDGSELSLKKIE